MSEHDLPDAEARGIAERIAREVYKKARIAFDALYPWLRKASVECVLAGMAHRDRTAEREAASKAWDAARDMWIARDTHIEFKGLAELKRKEFDEARNKYLAAEFEAGERTECERCGGLMPAHERQYAHHQELAACVDFLAATIKRLAEQRGAER